MTSATLEPTLERRDEQWLIRKLCPECHAEFHILSDEKPGELAMRVLGLAVCEPCVDRYEMIQAQIQHDSERMARLGDAALPAALHGFRWSEFDVTEDKRRRAASAAYRWARTGGKLALYGPRGTGKTHLAATAAWERLDHGGVRWCSVSQLITKASASFGSRERAEALAVLSGDGTLILDDLDKVPPTDYVRNQLFAAIDSRLTSGASIMVTTNLDAGELGAMLGDAIMSRVASFKQIYLGGRDRRQEAL